MKLPFVYRSCRGRVVKHEPSRPVNGTAERSPPLPEMPVLQPDAPPVPRGAPPSVPALVVGPRDATWLWPEGEIETLTHAQAQARLALHTPLLVHAPSVARRLNAQRLRAYDLLELFAFVRPASSCLPTPGGLLEALGLAPPHDAASACIALGEAAARLLGEVSTLEGEAARRAAETAAAMGAGEGGWPWALPVIHAIGLGLPQAHDRRGGLAAWRRLPEWAEGAPEPPPKHLGVTPQQARTRLAELLAVQLEGRTAEPRPQQADYASAISAAFQAAEDEAEPVMVLAEAGTGVGKTLGYLAAATVWAEQNEAPVWISTFTKALQNQIDRELDRLFPDAAVKARKVVVRKGRENYLCLLNYEEAVRGLPTRPHDATGLGLVARWVEATRDGDLAGGDMPGWLADITGRGRTLGLADRRGECIYSACEHYHRCFVERSIRKARRADIVIANHALVMLQTALAGLSDGAGDARSKLRLVFDEGHHLFEAADSAFSGALTAVETAELRRWLIGPETSSPSRARGLKRRVEELIGDDEECWGLVEKIEHLARILPREAWNQRVARGEGEGSAESFFALVRKQVYARAADRDNPYTLEADCQPPIEGLIDAALDLRADLAALAAPLRTLAARLAAKLDAEAEELSSEQRRRIESIARSLLRRGALPLDGWVSMLEGLRGEAPPESVDWFEIDRIDGRDRDVGLHRHFIDPTKPFAEALAASAHGVAVTSATLRDGTGDIENDWRSAEGRTGGSHWPTAPVRAEVPSPYDYPAQTRVLIVTDVRKDDLDQVAAAYRALFLASGGGGLGLFTAVQRLRVVHKKIVGPLEDAGLPLYAQHVDGLDIASLIEIFRADEHACLLGTDAVRDGVDVPGNALRLIVFDRVPWPRPTILHRARKAAFGKARYDDMITRLRLKQAFGRLIRRGDDKGVFVLLDPMMPSRLLGAFPPGVTVERIGLADAIARTRDFVGRPA
jgi:ATP-dependent DNA helicase DinG